MWGGPTPTRLGGGAAVEFRRRSSVVLKPGLAAAHLQGPTLFMHVWTTSFPWYPTLYHTVRTRGVTDFPLAGLRSDRPDGPQIRDLGGEHRIHLLGEVRLARSGGTLDDVRDGLGAADDDGRRRVLGGPVARDTLALEEL